VTPGDGRITGVELRSGVPLAPLTTLRTGGAASVLLELHDSAAFPDLAVNARRLGVVPVALGGGSNVLVADAGAEAVLLVRTRGISMARDPGGGVLVTVEAGTSWQELVDATVAEGLVGVTGDDVLEHHGPTVSHRGAYQVIGPCGRPWRPHHPARSPPSHPPDRRRLRRPTVTGQDAAGWRHDRVRSAEQGVNPTVVGRMRTGWAVIGDVQHLPGYCLLLYHDPTVDQIVELPRAERAAFLSDLALLGEAVTSACTGLDGAFTRVNLEVLGNTLHQLHGHVHARYRWSPRPTGVGRCGATRTAATPPTCSAPATTRSAPPSPPGCRR